MRNDLDGFSEVVTTTFFTQDGFVDLAGREVVELPHAGGDEAFVMTQIKVGFSAGCGNEDFAMLEGAHGARINVDIRIELQHGDAQATRFEDGGQRSSSNALTERGHYPTRDKYIFGHRNWCPGRPGRSGKLRLYPTRKWGNGEQVIIIWSTALYLE